MKGSVGLILDKSWRLRHLHGVKAPNTTIFASCLALSIHSTNEVRALHLKPLWLQNTRLGCEQRFDVLTDRPLKFPPVSSSKVRPPSIIVPNIPSTRHKTTTSLTLSTSTATAMERKRKLPARAGRVESVSKKRTSTPPEQRHQTPTPPAPPPPIEETLPRSIVPGKPLPTVERPQPDNLPAGHYQTITERYVLSCRLPCAQDSRQKLTSLKAEF